MRRSYARLIFATALTLVSWFSLQSLGHCQSFQVGVAAINTEYKISNPIEVVEDTQGISASLIARMYQHEGKGRFRVAGVFNFQRDSFNNPTDTYSFGPELSFRAGIVQPYAQARFGFDTTYNNDKRFSREYLVGARLILNNVYVEPLSFGWKRTEGLLSPSTHKLYSGIGINIK